MLAALLVALAIVMSITSKTPFLAYELATKMNHADRIEWYRMRDEKNNTRYIINFYLLGGEKTPTFSERKSLVTKRVSDSERDCNQTSLW